MTEPASRAHRTADRLPIRWGVLVIATVLAVGTVALIWLVAVPVGPVVCAAVYPSTGNCFRDNREGSALVMTLIVVAVYVVTVLLAALVRRPRGTSLIGVGLLAVAPFVSYAVVAWSTGFALAVG